jgi:hypothetical protein
MDTPSTLDPFKPPAIMLSEAELDEVEAKVAAGEFPPDWFQKYYAAIEANVFGFDHKKKDGKPVEQGLGSPGNQTQASVDAYRKWCTAEPDYERNLARLEKELADSRARRAAAAKAAPNKFGRRVSA